MWIYWILSLAGMGVVAYGVGRSQNRPVAVTYAASDAPKATLLWLPPTLDLEAVRQAGDRAWMAVRADQATRVPRSQRAGHLTVVAS